MAISVTFKGKREELGYTSMINSLTAHRFELWYRWFVYRSTGLIFTIFGLYRGPYFSRSMNEVLKRKDEK